MTDGVSINFPFSILAILELLLGIQLRLLQLFLIVSPLYRHRLVVRRHPDPLWMPPS